MISTIIEGCGQARGGGACWGTCDHPNVASLYGLFCSREYTAVFMADNCTGFILKVRCS